MEGCFLLVGVDEDAEAPSGCSIDALVNRLEALGEQLKSPVADCKNAGGRYGGAITAALFLQKFAKDTPWMHLDLAGPAFREKGGGGRPAGASGYGVATLLRFLQAVAEDPGDAAAPTDPRPSGPAPEGEGAAAAERSSAS